MDMYVAATCANQKRALKERTVIQWVDKQVFRLAYFHPFPIQMTRSADWRKTFK